MLPQATQRARSIRCSPSTKACAPCGQRSTAGATTDAAVGKELQLRLRLERLGVVAPETALVAALQEHRGADARPIVNREALNISDSCQRLAPSSSSSLATRQDAVHDRLAVLVGQRAEVGAVARDADHQVGVRHRVRVRLQDLLLGDHVHVDQRAALRVVGHDQRHRAPRRRPGC